MSLGELLDHVECVAGDRAPRIERLRQAWVRARRIRWGHLVLRMLLKGLPWLLFIIVVSVALFFGGELLGRFYLVLPSPADPA